MSLCPDNAHVSGGRPLTFSFQCQFAKDIEKSHQYVTPGVWPELGVADFPDLERTERRCPLVISVWPSVETVFFVLLLWPSVGEKEL